MVAAAVLERAQDISVEFTAEAVRSEFNIRDLVAAVRMERAKREALKDFDIMTPAQKAADSLRALKVIHGSED